MRKLTAALAVALALSGVAVACTPTPQPTADERRLYETAQVVAIPASPRPLIDMTLIPPTRVCEDIWIEGRNSVNQWLWRLTQRQCWWHNGPHVLGLEEQVYIGQVSGLAQVGGWRYAGIRDKTPPQPFNFQGTIAYWTYVQAAFDWCPFRIGCINTKTPWMQNSFYGWGGWSERYGV